MGETEVSRLVFGKRSNFEITYFVPHQSEQLKYKLSSICLRSRHAKLGSPRFFSTFFFELSFFMKHVLNSIKHDLSLFVFDRDTLILVHLVFFNIFFRMMLFYDCVASQVV